MMILTFDNGDEIICDEVIPSVDFEYYHLESPFYKDGSDAPCVIAGTVDFDYKEVDNCNEFFGFDEDE